MKKSACKDFFTTYFKNGYYLRSANNILRRNSKNLFLQAALAKELGISYAAICRWEKDNYGPQIVSQDKFYAFCERKEITFEKQNEK